MDTRVPVVDDVENAGTVVDTVLLERSVLSSVGRQLSENVGTVVNRRRYSIVVGTVGSVERWSSMVKAIWQSKRSELSVLIMAGMWRYADVDMGGIVV